MNRQMWLGAAVVVWFAASLLVAGPGSLNEGPAPIQGVETPTAVSTPTFRPSPLPGPPLPAATPPTPGRTPRPALTPEELTALETPASGPPVSPENVTRLLQGTPLATPTRGNGPLPALVLVPPVAIPPGWIGAVQTVGPLEYR